MNRRLGKLVSMYGCDGNQVPKSIIGNGLRPFPFHQVREEWPTMIQQIFLLWFSYSLGSISNPYNYAMRSQLLVIATLSLEAKVSITATCHVCIL
jgi:hypothetical protein